MNPSEAWHRFAAADHAVLGSVDVASGVHLVPVVHTCVDASTIVIAIDDKPKTTRALRRLANIEADPRVGLLAEAYDPDWSLLWWVRVDGHAIVTDSVDDTVVEAHLARYPQQRGRRLGPWIEVGVDRVRGWAARG